MAAECLEAWAHVQQYSPGFVFSPAEMTERPKGTMKACETGSWAALGAVASPSSSLFSQHFPLQLVGEAMEPGGKKRKGSVLNNAERLHVPRQATGRQLGAGWRSPLSQILRVSTLCANTSLGLCFYPLISSLQITARRSSPLCLRLSIMNNFSIPVPYIQPRVSNLTVGKGQQKIYFAKASYL